jgi:DNA-binding sugar fermentation-stimulating protein
LSDDHAATNTPCYYSPTWVGAHPSLGESIVDQLLQRDQLLSDEVVDIRRQVTLNTTSSKVTRADFVVTHSDDTQRVVEVKTVVDTDYSSETSMDPSKLKGVFVSQSCPYRRTGLFPWGNSKQKGPSNEPVVSARAIKHVMELTDIVKKSETQSRGAEDSAPEKATIVFLVIRSDAEVFRPNVEACPSFCRYLKQAEDAGVEILVPRVRWEVDEAGQASCYLDKMLGIEWPELDY